MRRLVLALILVLAACGSGTNKQFGTKADGMQAGLESVAQLVDSAFVAVQLGLDEVAGR